MRACVGKRSTISVDVELLNLLRKIQYELKAQGIIRSYCDIIKERIGSSIRFASMKPVDVLLKSLPECCDLPFFELYADAMVEIKDVSPTDGFKNAIFEGEIDAYKDMGIHCRSCGFDDRIKLNDDGLTFIYSGSEEQS